MNPTGPYMNPKWTPHQLLQCTSIWTPNGHPNGPPNEPPNGPSNEPPNKLPNESLNEVLSSFPILVTHQILLRPFLTKTKKVSPTTKGDLFSERFSLWLKSPNISAAPEYYPPKEKMLRGVIWHPFLEI